MPGELRRILTAKLTFDRGSGAASPLAGGGDVRNAVLDPGGAVLMRPGREQLLADAPSGTVVSYASGSVIGMSTHKGRLVFVDDSRNIWVNGSRREYAPLAVSSDSVSTSALDGAGRPTFAEDSTRLIIAGGGQLQQWQVTDALSKRLVETPSATNDPPYATHVAALGGWIIANDSRDPETIKWADPLQGGHETWQVLSFKAIDARPDLVRALAENTRELFVWGDTTCQVFGLGGDPYDPFPPSNTLNRGIAAPYAFTRFGELIAWLDNDLRVVSSNGHADPVDMAPDLALEIRALATVSDAWMSYVELGSLSAIIVGFPTEGRTFAIDLRQQGRWSEWSEWSSPNGWGAIDMTSHVYWQSERVHVAGAKTSVRTWKMDADSQTDFGGNPVKLAYRWPFSSFGTSKRKRHMETRAIMERGTTAFGSTAPSLEVRHRDDMGAWSPWRQASLGVAPDYAPRVRMFEGGIFRDRQYEMRYSGADRLAATGLEIDFEELAS